MAWKKERTNLARNEEGEFELVLGNRQLVSVFLIVVVLLGVFFSMGYFVGRNSPATPPTDIAARPANPIIVDNPSKSGSPGSDTKPAAGASATSSTPPERDNPPVETKPEPKRPVEAPPVEPRPVAPMEKPSPLPKEKRVDPRVEQRVEQRPEPATRPSVGEPRAGTMFLQVVATSRPDAELIGETLAKKGFHIVVAPGPSAAIFRVLVGPLNGAADAAETRVRLESSGFKNPYVRKY